MKIFIARYVLNHDALNPVKRMIEIDESIIEKNLYSFAWRKAEQMKKEGEFFLDLQYIGEIKERLVIKKED